MEHLRYVARSTAGPQRVTTEAAWALADLVYWVEPQGLLPACRRLVEWHPAAGALWNLAVRVLAAADPADEARLVSGELADDTTAEEMAHLLPEAARVASLGGDVWKEVRRLRRDLNDTRKGSRAEVIVIEASAFGEDGFAARTGASALAAGGPPVWVLAPAGSVVGAEIWKRVVARVCVDGSGYEIVDRALASKVIGPTGEETWGIALSRAAPESPPPTLR